MEYDKYHNQEKWEIVVDKYFKSGIGSLSLGERIWLYIRSLIDATENGGLISYFYNPGAEHLQDCLLALNELRAIDVKTEVQKILKYFPDGVPDDIDKRNDIINSWNDKYDDGVLEKDLDGIDHTLFKLFPELERKMGEFLIQEGILP